MSLQKQVEEMRGLGLRHRCYESGKGATLTVKLGNGECWVLPWGRFLRAHLQGDRLELVFAEYRVEIRGRNLGKLVDWEIANLELGSIRELPAEYAAVAEPQEPFISEIRVQPREESS